MQQLGDRTCSRCESDCFRKKLVGRKKQKVKQICEKYKEDDLFSFKTVEEKELIEILHGEWKNLIDELLTGIDMWSYDPNKEEMMLVMKRCFDIRLKILLIQKIEAAKENNKAIWLKVYEAWGIRSLRTFCSFISEHWPKLSITKKLNKRIDDLSIN